MLASIKQKLQAADGPILRIGGLIGAGLLAGLLYYKFRPPRETPKPEVKKSLASSRVQQSQQTPQKLLIKVINGIKKTFRQGNKLQYESVKTIYNGQLELSRKEFITIAARNRKERRQALKDLPKYLALSKEYEDNLEELHNRHLNGILAHFRISKAGWIELIDKISADNREQWSQFILDAEGAELDSLRQKDKPKVGLETLCAIEKFKAKKLQENGPNYTSLTEADPTQLYAMIEKHLADLVYEHFRVQIEDFNFSRQQLSEQQVQQLQSHEEQVIDLLNALIFNDGGSQDNDL